MNPWVTEFQKRLKDLYDSREAKNIAQWVLQRVCDCSSTEFLLGKCDQLDEERRQQVETILNRLSTGEPIQHIFGEGEFCGLSFFVNKDVLIPRPETAELVEWILEEHHGSNASFLDIGTGSGCIAISLKHANQSFNAHAMDISEKALDVAKRNAAEHHTDVTFLLDNILNPQTKMTDLDFIVSNPPYITEIEKEEMSPNVLDFEPHLALFVGNDNALLFYEAIAEFGISALKEGGNLYFEINEHYGKESCEMLEKMGYEEVVLKKDMQGKERMIKCSKRRKQ